MIQTHIAHDCVLGDRSVLANSAMLGGHVFVEPDVWVGAAAMVHQFQRIGKNAILGGGTVTVADVPPFCVGTGNPIKLAGINTRGLKRRNFSKTQMQALRKAYRVIFEGDGGTLGMRLDGAESAFEGDENVADLIAFIRLDRKRPLAAAR